MMREKGRIVVAVCMAAVIGLLNGCGGEAPEKTENMTEISLAKDGTVTGTIVSDFDPELYDQEELKEMTLSEVNAYNKENGAEEIAVDKLEEKRGRITVEMSYASPEAYGGFNRKLFFCGTVKEAYDAGIPLDIVLQSVKDNGEEIGREQLLGMGDYHLVVAEENLIRIRTWGKIEYASPGVLVDSGKKEADVRRDGDGLSYLVFR